MNSRPRFYDDPATPLVALSGGPQNLRWFFYADWLTLRRSALLGGYPLHHPCWAPHCYLPTEHLAINTNPAITHEHGDARTWRWVPPEQWAKWGRRYRTPEEIAEANQEIETWIATRPDDWGYGMNVKRWGSPQACRRSLAEARRRTADSPTDTAHQRRNAA